MPTSEGGDFSPGMVVVVPFPYADRLAEKRRPAVIVSGSEVLQAGYVWIAMITSARNARMPGDQPIADLDAAGLHVPSVVRPVKIACIEPTRILRRIGILPSAAATAVFTHLHSLIGAA